MTGLRCGDVFVPGSRRYADPASYLMTAEQWTAARDEFCTLVDQPADATAALAAVKAELHDALGALERVLSSGSGPVRLNEDGELVIPPLSAVDVPEAAEMAREEHRNESHQPGSSGREADDGDPIPTELVTDAQLKHTRRVERRARPNLRRRRIKVTAGHASAMRRRATRPDIGTPSRWMPAPRA